MSLLAKMSAFTPDRNQFSGTTDIPELRRISHQHETSISRRFGASFGDRLDHDFEHLLRRFRLNLAPELRMKIGLLLHRTTPEEYRTGFDLYERTLFLERLHHLGIDEERLKRSECVVDVGAGVRDFAGYAIRTGLNSNVYSVEPNVDPDKEYFSNLSEDEQNAITDKTIVAHVEAIPLPDQFADLVLAHKLHFGANCCHVSPKKLSRSPEALSNIAAMRDHLHRRLDPSFAGITRILKIGGEARIYSVSESEPNDSILSSLERLEADGKHSVRFEEVPPIEDTASTHGHGHHHRDDESGKYRVVITRIKT